MKLVALARLPRYLNNKAFIALPGYVEYGWGSDE